MLLELVAAFLDPSPGCDNLDNSTMIVKYFLSVFSNLEKFIHRLSDSFFLRFLDFLLPRGSVYYDGSDFPHRHFPHLQIYLQYCHILTSIAS